MAISVEDLVVIVSTQKAMDELYQIMKSRYQIKRFGIPKRYLGWHFHYEEDGSIEISRRMLIDKMLHVANVTN